MLKKLLTTIILLTPSNINSFAIFSNTNFIVNFILILTGILITYNILNKTIRIEYDWNFLIINHRIPLLK